MISAAGNTFDVQLRAPCLLVLYSSQKAMNLSSFVIVYHIEPLELLELFEPELCSLEPFALSFAALCFAFPWDSLLVATGHKGKFIASEEKELIEPLTLNHEP